MLARCSCSELGRCISGGQGSYLNMRSGRPKSPLDITDEERDKLRTIALRPKSAQAMALRVRSVLWCAQGIRRPERTKVPKVCSWLTRRALLRLLQVDQRKLAEPRRTAIRNSDRGLCPTRKSYRRWRTEECHARISGAAKPEAQALCVDRGRRSDSRQVRASF